MGRKLYVGGLAYSVTGDELATLFATAGRVRSAEVIADRDTGRSKGFGFVEMEDDSEAQTAMKELNGTEHQGRTLTVNEAKPRPEKGRGFGRSRY